MREESKERDGCNSARRSKQVSICYGPASLDDLAGEFESLEYEEDVYYSTLTVTPSFDEINEGENDGKIVVHCWKDENEDIDEILVICEEDKVDDLSKFDDQATGDELSKIEDKRRERILRIIRPILERLRVKGNYEKILKFVRRKNAEDASLHTGGSLSPTDSIASELQGLSFEEQERQKEEWRGELAKVEEEIQTLRHVLASKVRVSQELKRKLGISVWKELSEDVNQGIRNVKESQVFQKTESVFKTTAEKTTSILGGFGSGLQMKLGQMRNSDSFRSLEEKVGSAYENVKTKVVPSRSNSTQSFDEALRESESRRASAAPSVTSPTIPEEKMLS